VSYSWLVIVSVGLRTQPDVQHATINDYDNDTVFPPFTDYLDLVPTVPLPRRSLTI